MRGALIFARMCRLRKTMAFHVRARRLSVTKDDKWKKRGMSCIVYNYKNRLGRMWS